MHSELRLGRRELLAMVATASTAVGSIAPRNLNEIKTRAAGKVETVFRSPGPTPNGLQATEDGLWIIDQGNNKAYLASYRDGKVLREFKTDADRASGVTYDGEALWIGSTYSREIVRCDAKTGKTLARYFTPGAGVIYKTGWDAPARSSPLLKRETPQRPAPPQTAPAVLNTSGTGAHGQEWRYGKLWMAVPPSRMIYCIDPQSWVVQRQFPTAGSRPHGIGWEGDYLWCADSNLNAFFKHDSTSGEILEKIQLADSDPLPHGMSIRKGFLWYCDDVGVVCRLKI